MITPDLNQIKEYALSGKYKTVPVSMEILSDIKTPIEVLRILQNVSGHCYMLESVAGNEQWGRYTFLGYDPKLEITCLDGHMKIGSLSFDTDSPGKYIMQVLSEYKSPKIKGLPSFTGGLVGYFSYDYLKYSEPSLRLDAEDTEGFKDADLMLFDKVIAFDNFRQKIILIVNISLDNYSAEYNRALMELENMASLIMHGAPKEYIPGIMKSDFTPLFTREEYCEMVNKAKHHIKEGDIFQIVLSNRLEADFEGSLLGAYRILRTLNPSPYMFYFPALIWRSQGRLLKRLSGLKMVFFIRFLLQGRGREEKRWRRICTLKNHCFPMKRNLRNTICLLTSEEMILGRSAVLEV